MSTPAAETIIRLRADGTDTLVQQLGAVQGANAKLGGGVDALRAQLATAKAQGDQFAATVLAAGRAMSQAGNADRLRAQVRTVADVYRQEREAVQAASGGWQGGFGSASGAGEHSYSAASRGVRELAASHEALAEGVGHSSRELRGNVRELAGAVGLEGGFARDLGYTAVEMSRCTKGSEAMKLGLMGLAGAVAVAGVVTLIEQLHELKKAMEEIDEAQRTAGTRGAPTHGQEGGGLLSGFKGWLTTVGRGAELAIEAYTGFDPNADDNFITGGGPSAQQKKDKTDAHFKNIVKEAREHEQAWTSDDAIRARLNPTGALTLGQWEEAKRAAQLADFQERSQRAGQERLSAQLASQADRDQTLQALGPFAGAPVKQHAEQLLQVREQTRRELDALRQQYQAELHLDRYAPEQRDAAIRDAQHAADTSPEAANIRALATREAQRLEAEYAATVPLRQRVAASLSAFFGDLDETAKSAYELAHAAQARLRQAARTLAAGALDRDQLATYDLTLAATAPGADPAQAAAARQQLAEQAAARAAHQRAARLDELTGAAGLTATDAASAYQGARATDARHPFALATSGAAFAAAQQAEAQLLAIRRAARAVDLQEDATTYARKRALLAQQLAALKGQTPDELAERKALHAALLQLDQEYSDDHARLTRASAAADNAERLAAARRLAAMLPELERQEATARQHARESLSQLQHEQRADRAARRRTDRERHQLFTRAAAGEAHETAAGAVIVDQYGHHRRAQPLATGATTRERAAMNWRDTERQREASEQAARELPRLQTQGAQATIDILTLLRQTLPTLQLGALH